MKRALIMNFKFILLMNTFFYLTQYLIHEDGPGKKIPDKPWREHDAWTTEVCTLEPL